MGPLPQPVSAPTLLTKRALHSSLSAPNPSSQNDWLESPNFPKPFYLYWELWTSQNLPRGTNMSPVLKFQCSWRNVFLIRRPFWSLSSLSTWEATMLPVQGWPESQDLNQTDRPRDKLSVSFCTLLSPSKDLAFNT